MCRQLCTLEGWLTYTLMLPNLNSIWRVTLESIMTPMVCFQTQDQDLVVVPEGRFVINWIGYHVWDHFVFTHSLGKQPSFFPIYASEYMCMFVGKYLLIYLCIFGIWKITFKGKHHLFMHFEVISVDTQAPCIFYFFTTPVNYCFPLLSTALRNKAVNFRLMNQLRKKGWISEYDINLFRWKKYIFQLCPAEMIN